MTKFVGAKGTYVVKPGPRLGTGGNGRVSLAVGPSGEVAIKELKSPKSSPPDAVARFQNEVRALRELDGTHGVLPLVDAPVKDDFGLWFAMPVATTLPNKLGPDAGMDDICSAAEGIAMALHTVHKRGYAHRDIKPDNLYWYDGVWCLGDFGLVEMADAPPLTESGRKLGPAYYIAPEMLNDATHANGARADIYSFGKTLWVLVSGQRYPLPGAHEPSYSGASLVSYRDDPRCGALDELLRRMTLLDPARRPNAEEVARELGFLNRSSGQTMDSTDPREAFDSVRRALRPHLDDAATKEARISRVKAMLGPLRHSVNLIGKRIAEETGLAEQSWSQAPGGWKARQYISGPRTEWERNGGYVYQAGNTYTWHVGVGFYIALLSTDKVRVATGYTLSHTINGHDANSSSNPRLWQRVEELECGTPSGMAGIKELGDGLEANLAAALRVFAELVQSLPREGR